MITKKLWSVKTADCIHCGLCTQNCDFLKKYNLDLAEFEKRQDLAYHCFLCGKCSEVCPKNIDGKEIALNIRNENVNNNRGKLPDKTYKWLLLEKNPYIFSNYKKGKAKSALFMGCNFPSLFPKTTEYLTKLLKPYNIGVIYDCCGKPLSQLGLKNDVDKNAESINQKCKFLGVEEIIMVCPNCYHFLQGKLEIKILSIYDKLFELSLGRAIEEDRIPLYHPCPDRGEEAILSGVRKFLKGEEVNSFSHIQCCGLGGCANLKEWEISRNFTEKIKETGEQKLYTYCASCVGNFRKNGFTNAYHVLPLILGVEEQGDFGFKALFNRSKHKFLG